MDSSDEDGGMLDAFRRIGEEVSARQDEDVADVLERAKAARGATRAATREVPVEAPGEAAPEEETEAMLSRARAALAARLREQMGAAAATATSEENVKVRLDLNDEANIEDLEDRDLEEHRRRCRARLQQANAEADRLPTRKEAWDQRVIARTEHSVAVRNLREIRELFDNLADQVALGGTHAKQLLGDQPPHGYKAQPSTAGLIRLHFGTDLDKDLSDILSKLIRAALNPVEENLSKLSKKLEAASEAIAGGIMMLDGLDSTLLRVSRATEQSAEAYSRRLEAAEGKEEAAQ